MKKVLVMAALMGLLSACGQKDMSSAPATPAASTNATTSTNK